MQLFKKTKDSDADINFQVYYQVLSIVGYRRLWLAQVFSQTAANSLLFVLALHLYQISQSNALVSGLYLVYGVPALIFGMAAGAIVDKFDNRTVLLVSDLIRALLVLVILPVNTVYAYIYLVMLLLSIVSQFYIPALAPSIPFLVPKNLIISANGLFTITYFTSLALGSVLAGPLLKVFGSTYVFIFISFLFVVSAFLEFKLPKANKKIILQQNLNRYTVFYIISRINANLKEALLTVSRNRYLKSALLLLVSTQVVIAIIGTLGPGFADKLMKIDVRDASVLIMGPAVLGLVIGAFWVGSFGLKYTKTRLITSGLTLGGLSLIFVSIFSLIASNSEMFSNINPVIRISVLCSLFFVLGFANSLLDIPSNSILQENTSGEMRGRIYGILTAMIGGVGIMPVVAGGLLADRIGVGYVLLFLGLFIFSAVFLVRRKFRTP